MIHPPSLGIDPALAGIQEVFFSCNQSHIGSSHAVQEGVVYLPSIGSMLSAWGPVFKLEPSRNPLRHLEKPPSAATTKPYRFRASFQEASAQGLKTKNTLFFNELWFHIP
jgi:hypothetical protein